LPPSGSMNMTVDIIHLRNHLHSARRQLEACSLRTNPGLLGMACAEPILMKLDHVAFQVAMTAHGYPNYFEVWRYNQSALETSFFEALHVELGKFQPETSDRVRKFLNDPEHRSIFGTPCKIRASLATSQWVWPNLSSTSRSRTPSLSCHSQAFFVHRQSSSRSCQCYQILLCQQTSRMTKFGSCKTKDRIQATRI
jgi:hypothetical protein